MNTNTMRRVSVTAPGRIQLDEVPIPEPEPGELLIRTSTAGICGSDLHALHGQHPFMSFPFYPGHEIVGVVAALGSDVTAPQTGTRVVIEPNLYCGECKQCKAGTYNLCERLQVFGCTTPSGGMADYFAIAADRVHEVPAQLSDRQAALIEPLATPTHAVRLAGNLTGKAVVVIGCGAIGLLTLAAARYAGARTVILTDLLAAKRDRALQAGADAVYDAASPDLVPDVRAALGESADVVFDCVAIQATMNQSIGLALKGGTIVVVGIASEDVTVPLAEIQDKQLRIQGTAMYTREDYHHSTRMLLDGFVNADSIVTTTLPIERAAEAFARAEDGQQVKVHLLIG